MKVHAFEIQSIALLAILNSISSKASLPVVDGQIKKCPKGSIAFIDYL